MSNASEPKLFDDPILRAGCGFLLSIVIASVLGIAAMFNPSHELSGPLFGGSLVAAAIALWCYVVLKHRLDIEDRHRAFWSTMGRKP